MNSAFKQRLKDFVFNVPSTPPEKPKLRRLANITGIIALVMFGMSGAVLRLEYLDWKSTAAYAARHPDFILTYPESALPLVLLLSGATLWYHAMILLVKLAEKPSSFLLSRVGRSMGNQILILAVWVTILVPVITRYFVYEFALPQEGNQRLLIIQSRLESLFFAWGWIFVLSLLASLWCLAIINHYRNYFR